MTKRFIICYVDGTTEIISSGSIYLALTSIATQEKGDKVYMIEELEFWKRDDYVGE